MSVENVFRVAALSVFLMFIGVLLFFREPRRTDEVQTTSLAQAGRNFWTVITNPRFMLFLLIFTGYWIVYWQEFITLPIYVHDYISPTIDTELLLMTGPLVVIALTLVINILAQKVPALTAITVGTLLTALGWIVLIFMPTGLGAVLTLIVIALGEITQSPRYYEYISRLAPSGQQGTYMGFAFLPLGIGSLIGGKFGGYLIHYYGEVRREPAGMWWVIVGVGVLTAGLLWVYDKVLVPKSA
jgi:MFS family permease